MNTAETFAVTFKPRLGQVVEFTTTHPACPGRTLRGRVSHVGTSSFPSNPQVSTAVGVIELLARDWGTRVRVVETP